MPCVVYSGPPTPGGGVIRYTPDFLCSTVKPNLVSSARTFRTAFDWCCLGILVSFLWKVYSIADSFALYNFFSRRPEDYLEFFLGFLAEDLLVGMGARFARPPRKNAKGVDSYIGS